MFKWFTGALFGRQSSNGLALAAIERQRGAFFGDAPGWGEMPPEPESPDLLLATEQFLRAADWPLPEIPAVPQRELLALRLSLLVEELGELFAAVGLDGEQLARATRFDRSDHLTEYLARALGDTHPTDLPGMVDAYHDLVVVAYGGALESAGADAAWETAIEVAQSNLDKIVDGKILRREDGKIAKPEGWEPPDIAGVLEDHGWAGARA